MHETALPVSFVSAHAMIEPPALDWRRETTDE